MSEPLLQDVVVPVGGKDDAATTADSLLHYLDAESEVTVVYVVEKAGGAPDKASVEQREEYAQNLFGVVEDRFREEGRELPGSEILYGTDVAETIYEFADDTDASAVVFVPRSSGRLKRMLSGDVAYSLITRNNIPVVALPSQDS